MFECQGWGGVGVLKKWENIFTDSKLNVEQPQNLSHIYDTLTFMSECQGWGGGGSLKNGKKILQIQN